MIEALIKICGSLFIGGIGLALILISVLVSIVFIKEIVEWVKDQTS